MAFPLVTVLTAAPGIISAATDIIRVIKEKQKGPTLSEAERLEKVTDLIEKQALVIEELAVNNRNLVLAVRNNRIITLISLSISLIACVLAIWI